VFARSTPKHLRASAFMRARTPAPEMPNRIAKKKWAQRPHFSTEVALRAAKENYVPSDFMILAIFQDKRKRNAHFRPCWTRFHAGLS
jgi:hypothetical protein